MAEDRTPRITPHLLERGGDMCPRRLAHELEGRDADAGAFTRWRVRTPLVEAATLAHRPGAPSPTLDDFPVPPDLVHEEAVVWRHAAAVYVDRFAGVAATTIDHGCDRATESARFGVRVGGAVDVLVRLGSSDGDDADAELRQFELWSRPVHADPSANWEIALATLRLARLLSGQRLRVRHVDLLRGDDDVALVDYGTDLAPLREAFARRLDELRARARAGDAVPGTGCGQCRHIAGCPAHKEVA